MVVLLIFISGIIGYFIGQKSNSHLNTVSFYAIVIDNKEFLHVKGIEENDINHRGEFVISHKNIDAVYNEQGKKINVTELLQEMEIRITYDGPVMESYPSQITHVVRIEILK